MKKKLLAGLLTTAMLMSGLTGCGSDQSADSAPASTGDSAPAAESTATEEQAAAEEDNGEVIELEFWGWWSSEARKPYIQQMVDDFNASQSKYHVTYVDIPWGDIFTKNIAQIAAGDPCDIMANSLNQVRFRAEEGQVESLDAYVTDDVVGGFYEQYIDACTGEDGQLYALPFNVDTRGIYYNIDHFEEAGINPEDIQTWDDLIEAARKLDVQNGDGWDRIGFLPVVGNGGVDTWCINANGGPAWFNPDTLEVTVNSETNKEAFRWIREQIDYYSQDTFNEISAAYSNGMQDPFASGVLSMVVHTSSYPAALAEMAPDLNYGVIKLPEFKDGTGHVANGDGFVLEIPKGAKNPEGSYEFIKYITGKENQEYQGSVLRDFSARNDIDTESEYMQNPVTLSLAECLEETSTIIAPGEVIGWDSVINPLIEEGTLGVTDTDTALDNAQAALEEFVANNASK